MWPRVLKIRLLFLGAGLSQSLFGTILRKCYIEGDSKMVAFRSCNKCNNGIIKIDENTVKECVCKKKWRESQLLEIKMRKSNIPYSNFIPQFDLEKSYKGLDTNKNIPKLLEFTDNYKRFKSETLYFYGGNGTQKTTIAAWVAHKLLKQKYTVEYITMKRLVDLLLPDFINNNSDRINILKKADLLIIDESFDKNKLAIYKSGYQLSFLDDFVRERIQAYGKSNIFISNVAISGIHQNNFSVSLQDLMHRNCALNGCYLKFEDNYLEHCKQFDIKSIFG